MTDLALDPTFNVFLDDRNEVATVDGRAKFEQSVAVKLTSFMFTIPGETDFQTTKEKIRLQASRVARNHDLLDTVDSIEVARHPEKPSTAIVEIIYSSDDTFSFNINL